MDEENNQFESLGVHAGFPNAAENRPPAGGLSLDALVTAHPASTYFWQLADDAAPELGWLAGDIVVVDRALTPKASDWVVIVQDKNFLLCKYKSKHELTRANGAPIALKDVALWGVVTYIVQEARRHQ